MIATDYTKCLFCRWQDRNNVQCFDGHLQRRHITDCEGYEFADIPAQLAFKRQESHSELWEEKTGKDLIGLYRASGLVTLRRGHE